MIINDNDVLKENILPNACFVYVLQVRLKYEKKNIFSSWETKGKKEKVELNYLK